MFQNQAGRASGQQDSFDPCLRYSTQSGTAQVVAVSADVAVSPEDRDSTRLLALAFVSQKMKQILSFQKKEREM